MVVFSQELDACALTGFFDDALASMYEPLVHLVVGYRSERGRRRGLGGCRFAIDDRHVY